MSITYKLDPLSWDMVVDANGNLALETDEPMALAQDVASAVRTFAGECWYDSTLGLPYFDSIFGQRPAASYLRAQIVKAALTIVGVTAVSVVSLRLSKRQLTGELLVSSVVSSAPITVTF